MLPNRRCANIKETLTPRPECDHRLWTEVGSIEPFRLVIIFGDEEGSDTDFEQGERCPKCGLWLHGLGINPSAIASQRK